MTGRKTDFDRTVRGDRIRRRGREDLLSSQVDRYTHTGSTWFGEDLEVETRIEVKELTSTFQPSCFMYSQSSRQVLTLLLSTLVQVGRMAPWPFVAVA